MINVYNSSSLLLVNSFQAHSSYIYHIKQLPNGYVATSGDNTAKIWNVTTINNNNIWNLIQTYEHTSTVYAIEYISTDTMASSGASDQSIKIWSISTGQTLMTIDTGDFAVSLKLLSNGFYLAAGVGISGQINIYNLNNGGSLVSTLIGHKNYVEDLLLINSNLLASSSNDKTVCIWDLTTNTNKFILTGHDDVVLGLKLVSADTLASGSVDSTIKLWNITSGTLIRTLANHAEGIFFSVDMLINQILVSGSYDKTIKTWNISTGQVLNTIDTGLTIRSLAVLNPIINSKMTFKI